VGLESVPVAFNVFEDPTVVMPVSLVPGPSDGLESCLGWAPVVPSVVIPSIPDFVIRVPFIFSKWCLGMPAPVANLRVLSVL